MKRSISKLFSKFSNTSQDKLDLEIAEKMLEDFVGMLDESKIAGHPSPDYVLKGALRDNSLARAKLIVEKTDSKLPTEVVEAANLIVDYNRLLKEKKPVPVSFVRGKAQDALSLVIELRYGKE